MQDIVNILEGWTMSRRKLLKYKCNYFLLWWCWRMQVVLNILEGWITSKRKFWNEGCSSHLLKYIFGEVRVNYQKEEYLERRWELKDTVFATLLVALDYSLVFTVRISICITYREVAWAGKPAVLIVSGAFVDKSQSKVDILYYIFPFPSACSLALFASVLLN